MRRSTSSRSGSSWWKTRQISFWAEATVMAAYLINRSLSTAWREDTMYLWSGHPVELRDVEDIWLRCLFIHESRKAQA
ncbi:hypothetical protein Tco_1570132 [Tanacetum coccineum]